MLRSIAQSPHHLAYTGSGMYLVALAGGEIDAIERLTLRASERGFDTQVLAFARANPGRHIVTAVGSCHELSWPDDDEAGDLRWSEDQAETTWRVRDMLNRSAAKTRH